MIKTSVFDHAHLDHLKTALGAYASRQKVVADNIANVETEGFKAQEYKFEDMLRKAQGNNLKGSRTHEAHLPIGLRDIGETSGESVYQDTGYSNGVNDVNIDQEMTELATTELSYRLATRVLSMKYSQLREAVSGRVR
jgi:flagellar basal-body rod protein FlgB